MSEDEGASSSCSGTSKSRTTGTKVKRLYSALHKQRALCRTCEREYEKFPETLKLDLPDHKSYFDNAYSHIKSSHPGSMRNKRRVLISSDESTKTEKKIPKITVSQSENDEEMVCDPRPKLSQYMQTQKNPIPTSNRFSVLEEEQQQLQQQQQQPESEPEAPNRATLSNPKNPPPIVVKGRGDNHQGILQSLNAITSGDYSLKNTRESLIINTRNLNDYRSVLNTLKEENIEYHTYSVEHKKTHAFVLRGLLASVTPEEIRDDLSSKKMVVHNVFKMRTAGLPLFMVVSDRSWTVSRLNRVMPEVMKNRIQWENRRSTNPITQCRRCQCWGHSTGNCTRSIRCSKCAGPHEIVACTSKDSPKCANCGGKHRSFFQECPVYTSKLSAYYQKFPPPQAHQQKRYVPAPPPAVPAWQPVTQPMPQQQNRPSTYQRQFPNLPGQPAVSVAATAQPACSPAGFADLQGKWDRINSLINIHNMMVALDRYIALLEPARSNQELFTASATFFTQVLPTINLAP